MKKLVIVLLTVFVISITSAQTFNQFYGNIVSNTSQTNVLNDLTAFENFGIKTVGSSALVNTENWITSRYQSLGYTDVVLQPFTYSAGTSNNIIVTKTGTLYPNTFLIIDAHYDTINGPGTNDNGTGTVLLLELARLLKNVETEYSIKFIHFSGEEDGLVGSNYYVNNTVIPQNLDIRLVFNIDEVGGVNGMTNDTVVCERDLTSPQSNNAASNAATNSLAILIELYSNLETEISNAYASDYVPFENNGEIITGLYESNVSPVNHTINDNLANMDVPYAYEVIKGSLGAVLEFAVAFETLSDEEQENFSKMISISPNPSSNYLNITFEEPLQQAVDFKLIDTLGKQVYQDTLSKQQQTIALDSIASAQYFAVFKIDNKRFVKTIIIE
ncbi:M28 family peptidase [Psychroserpens burtonensis]|uniref:M28 family peptidase n=1 Tax=Psychroserpens burtonensis TaxID=49278 RepID=A0A5C7B684_9FLAO|nr:M28 family peptidase [Psychroserpens burtonensis]TXE16182.1 M28 family peptidase [Psychroserpens burtonensis]